MKTMKLSLLCLLAAASPVAVMHGQDYRTDINPALLYYQALMMAPTWSNADRDYLFTTNWQGRQMTEKFGKLIAGYDSQFKLVRQAAHATVPCDWGVDFRQGPATLLEHLARCKQVAETAKLRAEWDLQNGKEAEARDDLLAALALARNCSRDGSVISALVEIAIEDIVCSTVAENFFRLSPETLKQLADGFDAAPARGTIAVAILTEKKLGPDWMVNKILALRKQYPDDDAKVLAEAMKAMGSPDTSETNVVNPATGSPGGTSESLLNLFRDEGPYYDRLAAIMALPQREYEVQMKGFSAGVSTSSNIMFRLIFPAMEKTRNREFAILAKLAMVRAAVEVQIAWGGGIEECEGPLRDRAVRL